MNYRLEKNVMENDALRKAYNELAEQTFGLNFESWYQSGYCGNSHIPYTLFDGTKAVSNISVNRMEIQYQGKVRNYIQLGTVMTDPAYRNQGLSRFLMGEVLKDWKENCDAVFLFADQSVLDFYPRFGFERQMQYQYETKIKIPEIRTRSHRNGKTAVAQSLYQSDRMEKAIEENVRKLDMDDPKDRELLQTYYTRIIYMEKEIITDRLIIRSTRGNDMPFCFDIWLDEERGKYLSDPPRELADEAYLNFNPELEPEENWYYFVAERKETGELIGTCSTGCDEDRKNWDLGYCIHKNYWRQGYATEMIKGLIDFGYQNGGCTFTANVAKENTGSNAVMKKLGFYVEKEGNFRKSGTDIVYAQYTYRLDVE